MGRSPKTLIVWNDEQIVVKHVVASTPEAAELAWKIHDEIGHDKHDPRWQVCEGHLEVRTQLVAAREPDAPAGGAG